MSVSLLWRSYLRAPRSPIPRSCQQGYPTTQLSSGAKLHRSPDSELSDYSACSEQARKPPQGGARPRGARGEGEAARKKGMLPVLESVLSLQPTKNSELALHPNPDVLRPKTDRGSATCCPREEQRALSLQVPEQKEEAWEGGSGRLGRPLEGGLTLRHHPRGAPYRAATNRGSGAATSCPGPRRHWPRRANTFRRSGRSSHRPRASAHASQSSAEPSCSLFPRKAQGAVGRDQRNSNSGEAVTARHKGHWES